MSDRVEHVVNRLLDVLDETLGIGWRETVGEEGVARIRATWNARFFDGHRVALLSLLAEVDEVLPEGRVRTRDEVRAATVDAIHEVTETIAMFTAPAGQAWISTGGQPPVRVTVPVAPVIPIRGGHG